MKRSKFLGITVLTAISAFFLSARKKMPVAAITDCGDPVTPPVPEGPFYKDEKLMRVNIAEHKKGTPLEYVFKVEDKHCKPVEGAMVDIWQCDADGVYSDYSQEKTLGETWLRGYQLTDKKGECRFTSIFPGWYDGRITHLHAKVHINGAVVLTTNLFFPKDIEDEVFSTPLYPKGPNPTQILKDIELHVDKDTKRHDTLVMNINKGTGGKLRGNYTFAV
jgi:protocatechuate 3,4-dioxygenase beta subunit